MHVTTNYTLFNVYIDVVVYHDRISCNKKFTLKQCKKPCTQYGDGSPLMIESTVPTTVCGHTLYIDISCITLYVSISRYADVNRGSSMCISGRVLMCIAICCS